ncbi:MAG TPA: endo-1,4-beta-xylanase [Demequinaceae bacterium]
MTSRRLAARVAAGSALLVTAFLTAALVATLVAIGSPALATDTTPTLAAESPPPIQDLTPIKDTVDFPVGVAIDARDMGGAPEELLLRHFSQVTPENDMKPEAWYDASHKFAPRAEIAWLMDFASRNDLRVYGHVLVWYRQTPAWFFQHDDGTPLTASPEDQEILRNRMHDHIFAVAKYLSDNWGPFGGGNPVVAFDVVNEAVDAGAGDALGMRQSEWYRVLGEEYVDLAFQYADEAFNTTYAAPGAERPVTLFINEVYTDQPATRAVYLALIDRLLARGAPIDGIGHQFHVNIGIPVTNLADALAESGGRGLVQAVTEMDVPTGTPTSDARFAMQGDYYRDAFRIFREHSDEMFSVTLWGLYDARSWLDSRGGPLIFDDDLQAKPAYYGIVDGQADQTPPNAADGGGGSPSPLPYVAGAAVLAALGAGGLVWSRRRRRRATRP